VAVLAAKDPLSARLSQTEGFPPVPGWDYAYVRHVFPGRSHHRRGPSPSPGHTGWLLSSEDDALLIWGDIVHLHGIQFARPDVGFTVDVDGPQAIATRQRIMDMAATDRLPIAGMHIDFPAFGHIIHRGKGYAFVPEVWRPTP
jgi:hypothetical protein